MSIGKDRNRYCPCGSNKKYKSCHWSEDYWKGFDKFPRIVIDRVREKGKYVDKQRVVQGWRKTPNGANT